MKKSLKEHILNLYHMALSDEDVDVNELETVYKIAEEKGLTRDDVDLFVMNMDEISFTNSGSVLEKIEQMYDLARVAWADGIIDSSEINLLELFGTKMGFKKENIPLIVEFLLDEAKKGTPIEAVLQTVKNYS